MKKAGKKVITMKAKIKLDVSYGPFTPEGFKRAEFDVRKVKGFWPLQDESVEEIYSAYMLCRIPGSGRADFMNEAFRVLQSGGKMTVIVPYWSSARAIQDPTHQWPPIVDQSFLYYNKGFRDANGAKEEDYGLTCDFDFGGGYVWEQETQMKSADVQPFWAKHYLNAINDIQVVLTKRVVEKK